MVLTNKALNKLSEDLLLAVKMEKDYNDLLTALSVYDMDDLMQELNDDDSKKSFWINIYNAFYLIFRTNKKIEKSSIYKVREIKIANKMFSLDDVEHGILRRYRSKYSLGYFPKLLVSKLIKALAVDKIDYRIHFALNCGAKSCPPIAFYNRERIDSQLKLATQSFVEGETHIIESEKIVKTTSLFNWYKADFGGNSKIKKLIGEIFEKNLMGYQLRFSKYDWEDDLYNFTSN